MSTRFEALKNRLADINAIRTAISIMDWDQQTFMPRGAAEARAEHVGILSGMAHAMLTSEETQRLLEDAKGEAQTEEEKGLIRIVSREIEHSTKIPAKLVEEKSRLSAKAHEAWVKARAESNFKDFSPILERMFEIAGEEAGCFGYKDHIYDALLDIYEEGATHADCTQMFNAIKEPCVQLVQQIQNSKVENDDTALYGTWDIEKQKAFTEMIIQAVGFDMSRGRQDVAPHPFCTNFSVNDVRLTTRYLSYIGSAIFGSLHEAGHGMYEQGAPQAWDRTPLAGGVSLGFHESQSRLWENIVGRSKAFWKRFLPDLQESFPELKSFDLDTFYKKINKVEPSYIRVEADEVTYNLHVMLRFELESDILTGKLKVIDLPEAWRAKMEAYLGLTPADDARGCLQDVHWSMGSIGYFPTYSMGNLLSFQIWKTLQKDLGDTDALIAEGDFQPILKWLQDKIYSKGKLYPPKELVVKVTGKPLDPSDYLQGLTAKYQDIYELSGQETSV